MNRSNKKALNIGSLIFGICGIGAIWHLWSALPAAQGNSSPSVETAEIPVTADFSPKPSMGGGVNPNPHSRPQPPQHR